jgi:putative transposase
MPGMGRVVLSHRPHHVVQRGHNRQVVFAGKQDDEGYLEDLCELSGDLDIRQSYRTSPAGATTETPSVRK